MLEAADLTRLLTSVSAGDKGALDTLLPIIYKELRRHAGQIMKSAPANHTLQPTALVHEVFVRLLKNQPIEWKCRAHFFAAASQFMRGILVDYARSSGRRKRGGGVQRVSLSEGLGLSVQKDADVMAVDAALSKLAQVDARQAEIVSLRFFGGLSVEEVAAVLGVSKRTVEAEWTLIRAWLRRELTEG
ncbi:MAG TPA: sigma-70 family RNA polymerase sigma factor [Pseudomonadota bacterium]|nr:sigma-70 family RNA polymerase sigma factor [Pseudomonadota bacterium]